MPASLLRESPRFWYPDPQYDRCCDDTQLHVPYTAYTFLAAGYTQDVRYGGPTGPGWVLACVEINCTPSTRRSDEDNIASKFDFHTGPRARVVEELVFY